MHTDSKMLILCFILMVVSNVIAAATKLYNNTTNMEISSQNPTTLTPDGLTFSVWGPIYLLELCLVIYQCRAGADCFTGNARNWLSAAFILNAGWLPFFAYHLWWLSLLTIVAYGVALRQAYVHMRVDYNGPAHITDKMFGFAAVSMNLAWVAIATLLNVSIVFRNSNIVTSYHGKTLIGGNPDWAIACIALAATVAFYHLLEHGDFVYAMTTAWALFGIYRMQTHDEAIWAVCMAGALFAVSMVCISAIVMQKYKKKPPTNELERSLRA